MDTVARRARGNPIHLLLIVEKKYLAGCMSLPKGRDDVFLSPTTTQTFMNVEAVLSDDGDRMVQAENGSTVARHIFTQFKRYLTSLAGFDKPATDSGEVSLEELPAQESLRLMEQNKEVFRKVQEALKPDTDAATELFIKLTFAAPALDGGAEKKEVTTEDGAPADGATQRPVVRKCLLTSAQGSQLFLECMSNPKKRAAFFEHLASVIEGKVDSAFFYKTFFNSVYTSELILNSFGCSIVGAPATLNANEVKIICDGFSRFGLLVLCASGGSSVVAALVQALRPNYKAKPIGKIVSGDKRPRDTDDEEKHSGAASCPASLDAYTFPAPPSDWSFFFACAKSFVGGDMEDDETKPAEGGANEEGSESQAKAKRIELLSQHIVACRAVQIFIPHFTDSILDKEKNGSKDGDMQTFQQNCHTFLSELTQRFYSLVTHQHGNYVAQTMIAELAPRAVPNTPIFEFMREISNVLAQHAFDLSTQKCSSNCVERALECTMANPDEGVQFLFRVAKQFLSKAPHEVLGVATNMFGNYVVRHMCQSLSSVVVGNTKVTAPEVLKEAKDLEKQLFDIIEKGQATIQSVATGSGVMSWMTANKARITSS
ncbi:hypothetical protein AGDE_13510 [Angomonas deanei]|nr:hypothetical protein AGDE_13510 [Angomonas deanei]|eukprot:EPY22224.1 hypothetical protein AGDE_13510 [Angomonas deanei]